jgi:putative ABC transport system permease protein
MPASRRRAPAPWWREPPRALRRLSRAPGFTIVAVLTVALAVLPSVVFRLVDRAVLPPLPYERTQELVALWERSGPGIRGATSFPKLRLLRERSRTLEVAALTGVRLFLTANGERTQINAIAVTPSFFSVLGARPFVGRLFGEDDDRVPLARPVVVLSEGFWRRRFDGRKDVVGETIILNDVPFTVVGVTRAGFRGWWGVVRRWAGFEFEDAWIPSSMAPLGMLAPEWRTPKLLEEPHVHGWGAVGRMRPGYGLRQVRAELDVLGAEAHERWPEDPADEPARFEAVPLAEDAVDPTIVRTVALLTVGGGLVVLLGALDVGSLFFARGLSRARTISLERILGAPRSALVLGTLSEAVGVGAAGGLLALFLTRVTLGGLGWIEPSAVTSPLGVSLDASARHIGWRPAAWALALGTAAAALGSLVAAWRTMSLRDTALLRVGAGISGPGLRALRPTRPRGLLIVLQVAFGLALTLPALLVLRSVGRLVTADLGFATDGVFTTALALPISEYEPRQAAAVVREALDRLRQQEGVLHAAWVSGLPLDRPMTSGLAPNGRASGGLVVTVHVVSPDAFAALGIPLVQGRDFGPQDCGGSPPVVVLSRLAAQRLGVGVGARMDVAGLGARAAEVVGVAGDVPYGDPVQVPLPAVYAPLAQSPQTEGTLVVRSSLTTVDTSAGVRSVLAADRGLAVPVTAPIREYVSRRLARFRVAAWLVGLAAAMGLSLSGVGVHGVLSSLVVRSTADVGIRIALGATPRALGLDILRTTLGLAGLGFALGASIGLAGAGLLESYLYRVSRGDAWTVLVAAAAAAALALVAAWEPARRTMSVDPVTALRSE